MLHQRLHRKIERACDHHLPQSQLARLLDQLVSARKDRRLDHRLKQLLREVTQPVLRLALVTLEVEVIKNFSAILVRHREKWKAEERGRALLKTRHQAFLASCVKGERVNQIGAHQRPFKVIKGCSSHNGQPLYRIPSDFDNRKQKYYRL